MKAANETPTRLDVAPVRRVLLIEGVANAACVAGKLAVGNATGSAALLADAVHSLTDLANNAVALVAAQIASRPPDREHPYGHRKVESLAVFTLAVMLVVLAVHVAWEAGDAGDEVLTSRWGAAVIAALLVVQLGVTSWEARRAGQLDSDLLRADARHTLADVFVTASVLAGWQLAAHGVVLADRLAAWGVSALVLYLAWGLFRRAIPPLVDRSWLDAERAHAAIRAIDGVESVARLRSAGRGEQMRVDVVIAADPKLSLTEAHAVADAVEELLAKRFGAADVSVHIEPAARPQGETK